METRKLRLLLRTGSGIAALSEHCSKCRATADDGTVEVNAASLLSLFTLNIEDPVLVTLFGAGEIIEQVLADIGDDPRLQPFIINEENGCAPVEEKNGKEKTFLYKKKYV